MRRQGGQAWLKHNTWLYGNITVNITVILKISECYFDHGSLDGTHTCENISKYKL